MSPELEQIRHAMERATRDFAPDDWLRAPDGQWNSAQILEHLLLTYTGTTRGLMRVMEAGHPLGGKPTMRDRVATFIVAGLGFQPGRRTAPKGTVPRGTLPAGSIQKFNDALVAMDATLTDVEKRFGREVKILDHPIIGPLTTQQWRRVHRTHAMHHLVQIRQRSRAGQ